MSYMQEGDSEEHTVTCAKGFRKNTGILKSFAASS